ncbi:Cell division protein FtsL [Aquimixticola soesokkakensis]|uniref:Cell division protein FtsL n=1 Tax=Aquimixticola soesokkakensis TaxID=1519096 RepID=A0A1Y5SA89_9RHOB|nr:cell division protein FtsL [Aquimixticola soesokkakensis]SLN35350.1 Cell division protein FtsL [Aquimixticola soesokkakensis]
MRSILYVTSALMVMGLAFWAYHQNYSTQAAFKEVDKLQTRISLQREELSMLKAEWAYLNRPERLRELADLNFERLQLLPFLPEQFARIDEVDFPLPEEDVLAELSDPIDVVGDLRDAHR